MVEKIVLQSILWIFVGGKFSLRLLLTIKFLSNSQKYFGFEVKIKICLDNAFEINAQLHSYKLTNIQYEQNLMFREKFFSKISNLFLGDFLTGIFQSYDTAR